MIGSKGYMRVKHMIEHHCGLKPPGMNGAAPLTIREFVACWLEALANDANETYRVRESYKFIANKLDDISYTL